MELDKLKQQLFLERTMSDRLAKTLLDAKADIMSIATKTTQTKAIILEIDDSLKMFDDMKQRFQVVLK